MKTMKFALAMITLIIAVAGTHPAVLAEAITVEATLTCPTGQLIVKTVDCQSGETVVAEGTCSDGTIVTSEVRCSFLSEKRVVSSWSDQLKLDATLMVGGKIGTGAMTSLQLALTWYPSAGHHGLRIFGGAGYSFEPYHFVGGLEYVFRAKDLELGLGLSTHNFKSADFRLADTVLSGVVEARWNVEDPIFLTFQGHFGATWDNDGGRDSFIGLFGGLGVRFW